jgi:hypothetical protein
MVFAQSLLEICQLVQKLLGGADTEMDGHMDLMIQKAYFKKMCNYLTVFCIMRGWFLLKMGVMEWGGYFAEK